MRLVSSGISIVNQIGFITMQFEILVKVWNFSTKRRKFTKNFLSILIKLEILGEI